MQTNEHRSGGSQPSFHGSQLAHSLAPRCWEMVQRCPPQQQIDPTQSIESLHSKSKQRILKLWDELGVPEADRIQFSAQALSNATVEHVQAINDEIQRLLDRRNSAVQVEKNVEIREGFLYLLQELTDRYATTTMDKDRATRELHALVLPFRNSTLDCIESIARWRELMSRVSSPAQGVQPLVAGGMPCYLWKGVSYLHKINSDLYFLVHSRLGHLLDFEVAGNPLLDPRHVSEAATAQGQGGKLPPLRRGKDPLKELPKDRIDKAIRILNDEMQRQQMMLAARNRASFEGSHVEEDPHVANLAQEQREQQQLVVEEDAWLLAQQQETSSRDAENKASIKIQTAYRGYWARKYVKAKILQRSAVIKIQTLARQYLAKLSARRLRLQVTAARRLQALQRGIATREKIREIRRWHEAATKVQKHFRGHMARRVVGMMEFVRDCARTIQRVWRGHHARRMVKSMITDGRCEAATLIQRRWRGYAVRTNPVYNPRKIDKAVKLQAWARGIIDRRVAREMLDRKRAAIQIQSWWRTQLAIKHANQIRLEKVDHNWEAGLHRAVGAATKIQSAWRMHSAVEMTNSIREDQKSVALAALNALQQEERAAAEAHERLLNSSATKIQAQYRGHQARYTTKMIVALNKYATTMTRIVRGFLSRRRVQHMREEELTIHFSSKVCVSPVPSPATLLASETKEKVEPVPFNTSDVNVQQSPDVSVVAPNHLDTMDATMPEEPPVHGNGQATVAEATTPLLRKTTEVMEEQKDQPAESEPVVSQTKGVEAQQPKPATQADVHEADVEHHAAVVPLPVNQPQETQVSPAREQAKEPTQPVVVVERQPTCEQAVQTTAEVAPKVSRQ